MNNSYFRLIGTSDPSIPILSETDECPEYLYSTRPVDNPELLTFEFDDPIPKKPNMADFLPGPEPIISSKVYDQIERFNLSGFQLLPTKIEAPNGDNYDGYWAIHTFLEIRCVDIDRSSCEVGDGFLSNVKKIVLDENLLSSLPLQDRLIFRLQEDGAFILFHSSIIQSIKSTNPVGLRAISIEDWNDGSYF